MTREDKTQTEQPVKAKSKAELEVERILAMHLRADPSLDPVEDLRILALSILLVLAE